MTAMYDDLIAMQQQVIATLQSYVAQFTAMRPGRVWYVDAASPGYTGKRPDLAFTTIQEAVNAASDGDRIEVAAGLYDEGVDAGQLDGLRIDKPVEIVGTGITTEVVNTDVAATSCVHLVGETGTDIAGLHIHEIFFDGDDATNPAGIDGFVCDYDFTFTRIHNCVITNFNRGWQQELYKPERILFITDNVFSCPKSINFEAGGSWPAIPDEGGIPSFIERNKFLISGDFALPGTGSGIYVNGNATQQVMFVTIKDNYFGLSGAEATIHFDQYTMFNSAISNTFGITFNDLSPAIGTVNIKDDAAIGLGNGGFPNIVKRNVGMRVANEWSHWGAQGALVVDGYTAPGTEFTKGAWVEFFGPASTAITKHGNLVAMTVEATTNDDTYEFEFAYGQSGSESVFGEWADRYGTGTSLVGTPETISSRDITPGTRIAVRVGSGNVDAAANTARIRLCLRTYE